MLHVNFRVRCVKSSPFRSNQVTKSGGVQGEAEAFNTRRTRPKRIMSDSGL